jgi:hypothetical protein
LSLSGQQFETFGCSNDSCLDCAHVGPPTLPGAPRTLFVADADPIDPVYLDWETLEEKACLEGRARVGWIFDLYPRDHVAPDGQMDCHYALWYGRCTAYAEHHGLFWSRYENSKGEMDFWVEPLHPNAPCAAAYYRHCQAAGRRVGEEER